jgi:hypothetical protein
LGLVTGMAALEENMGIGADIGEWQQRQLCAVWSCETVVPEGYCCRVPYVERTLL